MNLSQEEIFSVSDEASFTSLALQILHRQSQSNTVYREYLSFVGKKTEAISSLEEIPFLPVGFFKSHEVVTQGPKKVSGKETVFTSSGTTGTVASRHFVTDTDLYHASLRKGFEHFYGPPGGYCLLALLPSYLERRDSSLVFLVRELIRQGGHPRSGFFLHNMEELAATLQENERQQQKTLLIGVSFALLDFAETFPLPLHHTLIMETGGMKGRRREISRLELHAILKEAFHISCVHSEYGMTELLSQAYSQGDGIFFCPPWMKVMIRDRHDPFSPAPEGQAGGINIIDLANLNSCSFLETEDLGRLLPGGGFEVLGRLEQSEMRGCNLMVE